MHCVTLVLYAFCEFSDELLRKFITLYANGGVPDFIVMIVFPECVTSS